MRIVPVLDVQQGVVVRGVAGRREEYRPIISQLTTSTAPLDVARAFRHHFDVSELYVADLDAIAGQPLAEALLKTLVSDGFCLWVDGGVRQASDAEKVLATGSKIVLGLETVQGPDVVREVCDRFGEHVLFSLDLKAGRPLGLVQEWGADDPELLAERAIRLGVRKLLLLDLARVGTGQGCGTEELCARLSQAFPEVEFWAGGGVSDAGDLERLKQSGAGAVLVASALHDGRIPPQNRQEDHAQRISAD